jgi:uroporphyrinogen III methyltransferase/synthase
MSKSGKVYLVGAGCGDYDLITLRGKKLIELSEVVVYDSLIDSRLLELAPADAEKICVGKRAGRHSAAQDDINSLLVQRALQGKVVVRLKGGDPFVFGRGGEEILALQEQGIEYAVVPGISSSIAVPELAGIPVTHRRLSRSFHIITGHTEQDLLPENMSAYASLDGTLVFLMGLKNINQIADSLIQNGKNPQTPAAVISNGAGNAQQVVRAALQNIGEAARAECVKAPAIIVVGEVAKFDFMQTISLPLKNTSVAVTGTKRFAGKLSAQLEQLGARVKMLDYLKVVEYGENPQLDKALSNLSPYSWIVLTSINGAEIFIKRLKKLKIDLRKLSNIKFAVIGSGTAEVLEKYGIFADLIPKIYTSRALGKELSKLAQKGERVLLLRAEQGSKELSQILDDSAIGYDDIKTYDVQGRARTTENAEISTDFITFASSSGVNAFFENGYLVSPKTKIVCIGEITANALQKHGISDFKISKTSNINGITDILLLEKSNS